MRSVRSPLVAPSVRPRRRIGASALAFVATTAAALSGCGTSSQADAPPATSPGAADAQVIERYPWTTRIASRGEYLAIAIATDRQPGAPLQLRVSPDGSAPQPAMGAGPLPTWAQPHVGTDESGTTVVVYPRCDGPSTALATIAGCDLYAWNAATGRESRLTGVSNPDLAETEGVMDRGNLLFVRETRIGSRWQNFDFQFAVRHERSTLLYKAVGEPERIVRKDGGRTIDLAGDRVADVTPPIFAKTVCGIATVRVMDLSGAVKRERPITCTERGGVPEGVSVQGAHLRFGTTVHRGPSAVNDEDLSRGGLRPRALDLPVVAWGPIDDDAAYALRDHERGSTCRGNHMDPPGPATDDAAPNARCELIRVGGLAQPTKMP